MAIVSAIKDVLVFTTRAASEEERGSQVSNGLFDGGEIQVEADFSAA